MRQGARGFLHATGAVLVGNVALPALSLLTAPVLARELGAAGRGELAAVTTISTTALILALVGTPWACVHFVGRGEIVGLTRLLLRLLIPSTAVGTAVLATLAFLEEGARSLPYALLAAVFPASVAIEIRRAWLLGQARFAFTTAERVLLALSRAAAIVGLALAGRLTVLTALLATLIPGLLVGVLLFLPANTWVGGGKRNAQLTAPRRAPALGAFTRFSLHNYAGILATYGNSRTDQLVLAFAVPPGDLGRYAVAVAVVEVSAVASSAVQTVVRTKAASSMSDTQVATAVRVTTAANALVVGALVAAGTLLIRPLFGEDFAAAVPLVVVLGLAQLFAGPSQVLETALISRGMPQAQSQAQGLALVLTLCGLAAMVPLVGVLGAALASAAAYAATYAFALHKLRAATALPWSAYTLPALLDLRLGGE